MKSNQLENMNHIKLYVNKFEQSNKSLVQEYDKSHPSEHKEKEKEQ
jgi:hypothetical protein